jgi:hypothetical protein
VSDAAWRAWAASGGASLETRVALTEGKLQRRLVWAGRPHGCRPVQARLMKLTERTVMSSLGHGSARIVVVTLVSGTLAAGNIGSVSAAPAGTPRFVASSVSRASSCHRVCLSLSPPQPSFWALAGGTSPPQTETLTNGGSLDAAVQSVVPRFAEFGVLNDQCSGGTLVVGGQCTFQLNFSPRGPRNIKSGVVVSILVQGAPRQQGFAIFGQASWGQPAIDCTGCDFYNVEVGTTASHLITIQGPAIIYGVSVGGGPGGRFGITNDICSGGHYTPCTFQLTFTPVAGRPNGKDDLIVSADTPKPPTHCHQNYSTCAPISGIGGYESARITPTPVRNFCPTGVTPPCQGIPVGTTSAPRTVTITNTNRTFDLEIGGLALSNPSEYSLVNDNCSNTTVAIGGACTFQVTFMPQGSGRRQGTVVFPANTNGAGQQRLGLLGVGV